MTIKHLSLCGGGIVGVVMYGILKRLHELKFWELKNIETIYTCSIGSFIGLMLILDIPWEWLDDFWIKRPWNSIFDFNNIDYFKYIEDKVCHLACFTKSLVIILVNIFKLKNFLKINIVSNINKLKVLK